MLMRVLLALLLASCQEQPPARVPAPVVGPGATEWLERSTRVEEERPEIVIRAMNLKNGDVVADVGAGSGFYTRRLARAVAPDGIVYANDIQPEMLAALRANAERERITNIVPILGTETDPKLPQGALDWVLLVDVYHELQQPQPILAAIRASLKPDGRVALVEYRETTERVRPEHRMSRQQVLSEWIPAGFALERVIEEMPMQRLYVFSVNR
jgi:ubiquinone/menaquinone biosynthesis C-methylase UbiE